jgi:tetratricopeptide (TPR) repeat protein
MSALFGQSPSADSLLLMEQANTLIKQRNYATAHILLEEFIEQNGLKPDIATLMIQNGLTHYYRHEGYDFFLLKDDTILETNAGSSKSAQIRIGRLRYPQRVLENLLLQHPNYAYAYKLLGDYYNIQLKDLSNFEFVRAHEIKKLEEKIFNFYSQADKLGYYDSYIYRWLGDYYVNNNQLEIAEKYYRRNIMKSPPDPISLYRLGEIYYQKKQYTQAYNHALESIKYFPAEDAYLKYDALRLSANSLRELGEYDRFIEKTKECLQLIPDLQDAYLDLIAYYRSPLIPEKVKYFFTEMFLKNPFELKGYRAFEDYIVITGNYPFADSLFNSMLVKYENWDEVLANIYWSKGNLAFSQDLTKESGKFWEISRNYMRRYLPENHKLIKQVGEITLKK